MAGIIPDNFSIDIGQQLMSNIVNLYAQKQQLDEKRKLEDERYKREQEMWEQRQVSTEEREKRMAEYQTQLKLDAQTKSMINAYEIQEGINFLKFKNDYLLKIKNDLKFRDSEIKRVGSEANLNIVVENLNKLTPSDVFNKTEQYYNLSKGLIEANTKIVYEEKSLETYRKLPQDIQNNIDLEKFLNSSPTEQQEMINWASNMINKEVSEFLNKIYGQTQETQNQQQIPEIDKNNRKQVLEFQQLYNSLNPNPNNKISEDGIWGNQTESAFNSTYKTQITTMQPTSELDKLELELSDKREKLNMLLQFKYQTPQIKEAIKNLQTEIERLNGLITSIKLLRERERLKPDKTQSSGTKAGKEQTNLQAQYDLIFKKYTQAIDEGKDEKEIKYYKNILDKIEIEAAGKNFRLKKPEIPKKIEKLNTSNFKWEDRDFKKKLDSNPILKKYTENPELIPFEEIDKYIAIYQRELDRETNEGGVSFISRKNDTDIKQLSELIIYLKNRKQSESQQPTQNKGMQKLNTDRLGLFN